MFIAAASAPEFSEWLRALQQETSRGGLPPNLPHAPRATPVSHHGAPWRGCINRELQARVSALSAAASLDAGPSAGADDSSGSGEPSRRHLPHTVDVDGPPEVGAELRVRGAGPIEGLCVAWFRLPGSPSTPLPSTSADVTAEAGFSLIPGAVAATYTVTSGDVGFRLGATVRPAVGSGGRWGLQASPVRLPAPEQPGLRLRLRPHVHTKYCDRRVRVCTAVGRYREGEVIEVLARGPAADDGGGSGGESPRPAPGLVVHWYRSERLVGGGGGGAPPGSARSSVDSAEEGSRRGSTDGGGGDARCIADLPFTRVDVRPVSDLPPAPPDSMPAPSIAVIKAALAPRAAPAQPPRGGFQACPLFVEDVGCLVLAILLPEGAPPPPIIRPAAPPAGVLVSVPVGPVEPAPPRARELWVEGTPAVGALLVGCTYYYGGLEGESVCSWVAIGEDGESREVKEPRPCPPPSAAPLPTGAEPIGSAADSHPRALRLTPQLRGCLIKFRLQPVRCDGNAGHVESSRPTVEVA